MAWYQEWAPYVSVAERRRRAKKKMDALRKKGTAIHPIEIEGRKITKTFWGQAWCNHLEAFSDFENRLPRGRTYVRNGSVCHLAIDRGEIEAKVMGSELYTVRVKIKTLPGKKWTALKNRSAGQIGSLLELLQGRLSDGVMQVVTDPKEGLFPLAGEMSFQCSCPDWASMCKHVAAVLYGVGARLDHQPELLFKLRGVNHGELIAADAEKAVAAATTRSKSKRLAESDLSDVFGIELESTPAETPADAAMEDTAVEDVTLAEPEDRPARRGRKPSAGRRGKAAKAPAKGRTVKAAAGRKKAKRVVRKKGSTKSKGS